MESGGGSSLNKEWNEFLASNMMCIVIHQFWYLKSMLNLNIYNQTHCGWYYRPHVSEYMYKV